MTTGVALNALQALTGILVLLFTPQILQYISQRQSGLLVSARYYGNNLRSARIWRVEIIVNRPIYSCKNMIIMPLYGRGKFFYFREIKLRRDRSRAHISELGFIELDLSYSKPNRKIKINCYLNKPDLVEIISPDRHVRMENYYSNYNANTLTTQSILDEAKWRMQWIFRTYVLITIGTLAQILHLGFFEK